MASYPAGIAQLESKRTVSGRGHGVMIALAIGALIAMLCAAFFATNAGANFPEPLTQVND